MSLVPILTSAFADAHQAMGEMNIARLSASFAEKLRRAHAYLREEMNKLGLLEEDGWKIAEILRECRGGSELVLRPLHLKLEAPEGLECVVWFVEEPARVGAECTPAAAAPREAL